MQVCFLRLFPGLCSGFCGDGQCFNPIDLVIQALAGVLHFGFGLTMFYDFSMTMLALLFLFTPAGFPFRSVPEPRVRLRLRRGQWTALTTLVAVAFAAVTEHLLWDMFDAFALAWWLVAPALLWSGWRLAAHRAAFQWPAGAHLLRCSPALLPLPLALFLMGACPYVGSKTETSLAMYSNLRTEGGVTNHLLVARPWTLFGYQTDLVRVLDSSDAHLAALAADGYPVPFYVLRERVNGPAWLGHADPEVTYERGGEQVRFRRGDPEPHPELERGLTEPPSYFERKFLRFRTILPPDANAFAH